MYYPSFICIAKSNGDKHWLLQWSCGIASSAVWCYPPKKLIITNCHQLSSLPKGIGKLVNLEVLRLRSCIDLFELPESIKSLDKLRLFDIFDCLSITHLPKEIDELCNWKELHMKGCLSLRKGLPLSTTNLKQLKLVICDEEIDEFWEAIKEVLTNIEVKVAEKDINLTCFFENCFLFENFVGFDMLYQSLPLCFFFFFPLCFGRTIHITIYMVCDCCNTLNYVYQHTAKEVVWAWCSSMQFFTWLCY